MNNLVAFIPFVFFNEDHTYPFILAFSLTLDLVIYDTYFLNTLFFSVLYLLNRQFKTKHNLFFYLLKNIINLTIALLFYSLITNNFLLLNKFFYAYLINTIIALILYFFHRKTLVIK